MEPGGSRCGFGSEAKFLLGATTVADLSLAFFEETLSRHSLMLSSFGPLRMLLGIEAGFKTFMAAVAEKGRNSEGIADRGGLPRSGAGRKKGRATALRWRRKAGAL